MKLKVGILVSPCPSVCPSPHYSPCYSPHYGWDVENWECRNILRVFSTLWLKCGYNAEISSYSCQNTPIRIFSAFFSTFSLYKNAEISPRSCPNTPIRIFSAKKMRRSGVRARWELKKPGLQHRYQWVVKMKNNDLQPLAFWRQSARQSEVSCSGTKSNQEKWFWLQGSRTP